MIPFDDAMQTVLDRVRRLPSESVDFKDALGRVLADDVLADMDMPPFNKSAMDGYACRREDLGQELRVIETIAAGCSPSKAVAPKECSKIMTGAEVPEGADCVIMVEFTEECGEGSVKFTGDRTRTNICIKGEDISEGDTVMRSGTLILDRHVAVLATVGCVEPVVSRRPKVGILATGDELVEPHEVPGPAQIRNSNAWQLRAQILRAGSEPTTYGIASDREDVLESLIRQAAEENDVILLSGGVSAGDYDLVPQVLRKVGFDLLFEKVAIQPGMPTVFGLTDDCFCFGLPGNPVSTFVLFDLMVKPFLYSLMGHAYRPWTQPVRLASCVKRRKTTRASWIPVSITDDGTAAPVDYHGSAHSNALCEADGLICVPMGVAEIAEGTLVDVRQI
jgi:molybdopterin molybdotransferase